MKTIYILLASMSMLVIACETDSTIYSEQITGVQIVDISKSMGGNFFPSPERFSTHIKEIISFNEDQYFGSEVSFFILPVNGNLINRPIEVQIRPGIGEWNEAHGKRRDYVLSQLNKVESVYASYAEMEKNSATELYSSLSHYLRKLSTMEGRRIISVVTDGISNEIQGDVNALDDATKIRGMYDEFIAKFIQFHDITKYDLSGIEVEFIQAFDGQEQEVSYEMFMFFDHWFSELGMDVTLIESI